MRLALDARRPDPAILERAATLLRDGGLVAFPTETVYGLGANALDPTAVARVFRAKDRDRRDPLIVHVSDVADLSRVAARALGRLEQRLAAAFWPGPLTLVLPKAAAIPAVVTGGLSTVAVRVPAHPVAFRLVQAARVPVAAPSANRFRRPSATTAEHVLADLGGQVDLVLDAGPAPLGLESTIVQCVGEDAVRVLRPGMVTVEEVVRASGSGVSVLVGGAAGFVAPGQDIVHYQPRARLLLVPAAELAARLRELEAARVGPLAVMACGEDLAALDLAPAILVGDLGSVHDLEVAGRRLFATMRRLDAAGVAVIVARDFPLVGLGVTLHDRLVRAAARRD